MEQPYSFLADWLSKFQIASEPIQALWILALAATALGVTWLVMRGAVGIVEVLKPPPSRHTAFLRQEAGMLLDSTPVMRGLDPRTHDLTHVPQENVGWPGQPRP